ncbi:MAG: DNA translocase FtsK [Clostridia bacterium]|nr:DNA translocase FtsK [Clostridia bacterium]
MNNTRNRYQGTYSKRVKRNNQKKRKKFIRALLIILAALAIIAVFLSKVTSASFFIAYLIEISAVFGLMSIASYIRSKNRKAGKSLPKKSMTTAMNRIDTSPVRELKRYSEGSYTNRSKKSNFDWVLEGRQENAAAIEIVDNPGVENKKSEIREERKFVPYRSPFEPINPVNKPVEPFEETTADGINPCEANTSVAEVEYVAEKESGTDISIMFDDASSGIEGEQEFEADEKRFVFEDSGGMETVEEGNEPQYDEYGTDNLGQDNSCDVTPQKTCSRLLNEENAGKPRVVRLIRRAKGTVGIAVAGADNRSREIKRQESIILPPTDILKTHEATDKDKHLMSEADYNAEKLVETLASFGVGAKVVNVSKGPAVTRYELQPNIGVKVSKIVNLADDIALNLAATAVRIEAPIPGKAAIGIEIPNKEVMSVLLRDVIESEEFVRHSSKLAFAVGKDISGNTVVADIAKMPHLLIAGATGSGKSVCINTLIASILYKASPSEVRLLMIDPKVVELNVYNGIPHLLIPVVTDPKKAAGALNWAIQEMTSRYKLFADNNVRDLKGFNNLIRQRNEGEQLPQIVIIIDELADLMMVAPNDVEDCICRLAQMARAAGMHLVIATQRPSVDIITGVIKANIPSRISFAVTSQVDSRTILDMAGAEKLLGRGDMLFSPIGEPKPIRVQGAFISDKEVESIVDHLKASSTVEYDEEILQKIEKTSEPGQVESDGDDELLQQAIDMVIDCGQASSSLIQRKFKVGYARAARIVDQMEAWGVVSASDGSSKARRVLITRQEWEDLNA